MKPLLISFLLSTFPVFLFGQEKGVSALSSNINMDFGTLRAVIIGISDYQDKGIPDLRFAHRDAEEFANYLRRRPINPVSQENLRILTNSKATTAGIVAAFDWLMTKSEEGDECIIFFSGHGDVETKTRNQMGFLLTWDSPSRAYMAGAYPLFYLQSIISTLTLDSKAKTLVVLDACRSGKLAGSPVQGAQLTNANLAKQFATEIKLLSCQPNEYSQEGEQWGGGRGAFSYFLLDGLFGSADQNENGEINLLEIGRHLEDNVISEVTSQNQTPVILGSKSEIIGRVDKEFHAEYLEKKLAGSVASTSNQSRGIQKKSGTVLTEDEKVVFNSFYEKIESKQNLEAVDSLFQILKSNKKYIDFMPQLQEDYAVALQDEVQQALNALLKSDPAESNKFFFSPEKYHLYPDYIQKAIELLGEEHYSVPALRAKKFFFQSYNMLRISSESDNHNKNTRDSFRIESLNFLDAAILLQPDAAYLYFGKMLAYFNRSPSQVDSVLHYQKIIESISPQWILPLLQTASEYSDNLQNIDEGEKYLLRAREIDPNSFVVLERLIWLYQTKGHPEKALPFADTLIKLRPELFNGHGNKGSLLFQMSNYPEAIISLEKSFAINDLPQSFVPQLLGYAYMATKQNKKGIDLFEKMISDERTPYWMKANYYSWYGKGLLDFTDNLEKAEEVWDEALKRRHTTQTIIECLTRSAQIKLLQKKPAEAEALLKKAFIHEDTYSNAFILAYALQGEIEALKGKKESAEVYYKKGADYPGDNYHKEKALFLYGSFLLDNDRLEEAGQQFGLCNYVNNDRGHWGYYGLAKLFAKSGNPELTLKNLEEALDRLFSKKDMILEEPLFDEVRKTKEFKDLMKKHFN